MTPPIPDAADQHEHEGECTRSSQAVPTRPLVRRIVLAPIFGYRRFFSPGLGARCRYEPSCSAYAIQAIDGFGILRGLVLATWRVARCQPFGGSGLDRPEDQTIFPLSARLKRAPHS